MNFTHIQQFSLNTQHVSCKQAHTVNTIQPQTEEMTHICSHVPQPHQSQFLSERAVCMRLRTHKLLENTLYQAQPSKVHLCTSDTTWRCMSTGAAVTGSKLAPCLRVCEIWAPTGRSSQEGGWMQVTCCLQVDRSIRVR